MALSDDQEYGRRTSAPPQLRPPTIAPSADDLRAAYAAFHPNENPYGQRQMGNDVVIRTDRAVPAYATEDRITYNRAKAQQIQSAYRAFQAQTPILQRGFQSIEQEQARLREVERGTRYREGSYANPATEAYARDLSQADFSGPMRGIVKPVYDIARTDIPYADRAAHYTGKAVEQVSKGIPGVATLDLVADQLPYVPRASQVYGKIAETLVPQEVWDTALTLLPAAKAKSVPELLSAITIGDVDAVAALRNAGNKLGESSKVETFIKTLASERGSLNLEDEAAKAAARAGDVAEGGRSLPPSGLDNPPSPVPDAVVAALKNRNKAVAKNPESLQQAWELLPVENQKMIVKMADAVLTPAERKAITRAGKARQTARAREAIDATAGSTLERAQAARAAMKGRYIPQIAPIGEAFTEPEIKSLFEQIDTAFNARKLIPQEHAIATDAMELLMYGKRPLDPDKPLSLMPHEIKLLGRIYGPEFEAILPKSKRELSLFQKAIDIANLPRAIISGIDVSAPGRQGIMLAARNPKEWGKAWGPMLKSMLSESRYTKELHAMQSDAYFEDAVLHGIDFTDIGGGHTAEEAFQTHLIQDNPILRNTIGRGERGYTVYLDKLRLETYKKGARRLERTAAKYGWEAERLDLAKKDFAGFVNHASGRGDLGGLNQYVPALNAVFFSPRFVVSRPQTIYDLMKSDPAVRQMIGENLGAFVGTGVLLLTAVAASGLAQVELNPRSSDFGKMRFGNQRIEFWGGWQPLARYIAQVGTGQRKTLGTGEIVDVNRGKTVGRFIRSKLSPAGALGWDTTIEGGKNYEGKNFLTPRQLPQEAVDRLTPLVIQDAIEGYRAQGPLAALSAAAVSTVGGGVGTFEESESEQKAAEKSKFAKQLAATGVDAYPDIAVQKAKEAFPDWPFEGDTYDEAIEALKADAEKKGIRYQDMAVYKDIQSRLEKANLNARKQSVEVDALWVILNDAKPLTKEAQDLVKKWTGITVELNKSAQ